MKFIVTEVLNLINGIRPQPASIFEMTRADVNESVGQSLSALMGNRVDPFSGPGSISAVNKSPRAWPGAPNFTLSY
jgi:hypothetical protein